MILQILFTITVFIMIFLVIGLFGYSNQKNRIQELSRKAQDEISKATLEFTTKLNEMEFKKEDGNEYK